MQGDDKRRYCGRCRLDVYNLSAMTTAEAAALVEQHPGRLCIRFVRAHDGKVMTADCPHQAISRRRKIFAAASLLLGGLFFGSVGRRRLHFGPGRSGPLQWLVEHIFGPPMLMGEACPAGPTAAGSRSFASAPTPSSTVTSSSTSTGGTTPENPHKQPRN
jgi:hypothetical protein